MRVNLKSRFIVGDVVLLKSGSPPMVVTAVTDKLFGDGEHVDIVAVTWIGVNIQQEASFPAPCLKRAIKT